MDLKANFEGASSCNSFNRLVPRRIQHGFHRFNLHRPTLDVGWDAEAVTRRRHDLYTSSARPP